jgi:hypothetical protein
MRSSKRRPPQCRPTARRPTIRSNLTRNCSPPIGAQIGGENEAFRTLLLDANAKVGELDMIKDAVGRLVDPVSRALRAIEAKKSEKAAPQTVLNNTRTAYGKLRSESA